MSLLSVVGECLSIGREGRPIHFARCPSPRKHDILMNVCQSGPDATNRPLERPIAINAPLSDVRDAKSVGSNSATERNEAEHLAQR